MKNQFKKTMNVQMISSALLVFCLSIFLSLGETVAQNNSWKSSAPNPPTGLSTDEESMVSNGGRSYDLDQFLTEVDLEQDVVRNNSTMSNAEKTSRLKILEGSKEQANLGLTIEASFNQAYNFYEPIVSDRFPQIDFISIRDEYIDAFEQ